MSELVLTCKECEESGYAVEGVEVVCLPCLNKIKTELATETDRWIQHSVDALRERDTARKAIEKRDNIIKFLIPMAVEENCPPEMGPDTCVGHKTEQDCIDCWTNWIKIKLEK